MNKEEKKLRRKEIWKDVFKLLGLVVLHQLYLIFEGLGYFSENAFEKTIGSQVALIVVSVLVCYVFYRAYRKTFKQEIDFFKEQNFRDSYLKCMKGAVLLFLLNIVCSTLIPTGVSENQQIINDSLKMEYAVYMALGAVFTGPWIEEVIFRNALIKRFSKYFNKYVMAIISICAFAGVHCTTWLDFIGYLPISIGLTYYYFKNDENIAYSFTTHCFYNFIGIALIAL